jgi:hypothetical protein
VTKKIFAREPFFPGDIITKERKRLMVVAAILMNLQVFSNKTLSLCGFRREARIAYQSRWRWPVTCACYPIDAADMVQPADCREIRKRELSAVMAAFYDNGNQMVGIVKGEAQGGVRPGRFSTRVSHKPTQKMRKR